jgi:hypothetical protein
MPRPLPNRALTVVLAGVLIGGWVPAVRGQGLGDAAKREKARRSGSESKPAPKVHTNDSILPEPGSDGRPSRGTLSLPGAETTPPRQTEAPPASSPRATRQPPPSVAPADASGEQSAGKSTSEREQQETYWRTRLANAKEWADRTEAELRAAEKQGPLGCTTPRLPLENEYLWRQRAKAADEECKRKSAAPGGPAQKLERARAQAASARQALDDLYEEARRKSVPPGWLR